MYTVNGKNYAYNSVTNQCILDRFVSQNIYAWVTDMITDLQVSNNDAWNYEEFENTAYQVCNECGDTVRVATGDDAAAIAAEYDLDTDDVELSDYVVCEGCGHTMPIADTETAYAEPLEYWIVSYDLYNDLKACGEMVMDRWSGAIWGRQTSGQAIMLDDVISRIAYDHGILEGQPNSWEHLSN